MQNVILYKIGKYHEINVRGVFFIARVLEHKTVNKYNLLVLHVIGIRSTV